MNFFDVRQFRTSLYVLLLLGMSAYALAVESPAIFVFGNMAIAFNWWLLHQGRFRPLPRWGANLATMLALAWTLKEFFAPGAVVVLVIGNFLVLLQLVKLWEQRANRDLAQLLVLSLLLMVAASINTARLLFGILLIVYLFLSLYCCLLLHLKVEAEAAKAAAGMADPNPSPAALRQDQRYLTRSMRRLTGLVSIVSVICAVIVFVFFPRGTGANFIGPMSFQPEQTLTGFDDQVSFGSVAKITQNPAIVAHAQIWKDDTLIKGGQIMLRGVTLDYYDPADAHWSRSSALNRDHGPIGQHDNTEGTTYQFGWMRSPHWRQMISLEPTGTTVLFSLAGPDRVTVYRSPHVGCCSFDGTLHVSERLVGPMVYEVISSNDLTEPYPPTSPSSPEPSVNILPPDGAIVEAQRASLISSYCQTWARNHDPDLIDSRIRALASRPDVCGVETAAINARIKDPNNISPLDATIAQHICDYLRTHYQYTLDLTDYSKFRGKDRIVAFLYDLKRGHCEYFAGSMALMCQSLGLHARVVVGFKSDEFNSYTDSFLVRESDAHAWVEVLTADGWKTYDPTTDNMADGQNKTAGLWDGIRHFVDFLQYTYATAVITYDNNDRANIIQSTEMKMTAAATGGQLSWNWLRQEWSDVLIRHTYVIFFSNALGAMMAIMVAVGVGFMGYFLWEKWMLRRRARRMGIASLPAAEQARLARQLGFYDDMVQLLDRFGIRRPRHLTPMEFSDSLLFLPSEAFGTIRRLTEVFYRVRFGAAELGPAQQRRLYNVLARLGDDLGKTLKAGGGSPVR